MLDFPPSLRKVGTGYFDQHKLGKSASSTSNDFGRFDENFIFTRQLTSTEEQKEGYLIQSEKLYWFLDANHPYKNVAPIFDNKPLTRGFSSIGCHKG